MSESKAPPKRAKVRFNSELGTLARVDLKTTNKKFEPTINMLVLNESFDGCALVSVGLPLSITAGAQMMVEVGRLAPAKAEVRWIKPLDTQVFVVGLQYLRD